MSNRRWNLVIIKWKKYNKKDDQNKYLCRIIWRAKIKVEMRTIPGDVLRSNFIRSTSIFDRRFLVEIEHWALGRHKLNRVLMSTLTIEFYVEISHLLSNTAYVFKVDKENLVYKVDIAKIMNVDIKPQVNLCRHRAQLSMSTLRPKSICVNIDCNFCVDLLNFDLNNSTQLFVHPFWSHKLSIEKLN